MDKIISMYLVVSDQKVGEASFTVDSIDLDQPQSGCIINLMSLQLTGEKLYSINWLNTG